jgi:hypothetical protein
MENNLLSDDLRFIGRMHTTTRLLYVCTEIVKIIGTKELPVEIVKKLAIDWSIQMNSNNLEYSKRKGKLTSTIKISNKVIITSAFEHYIQLLQSFGLITKTGNLLSITKIGSILNLYAKEPQSEYKLNQKQKAFYIIRLFTIDSDALILILNILNQKEEGLSQKYLLLNFKDSLLERLNFKIDSSNSQSNEGKFRDLYLKITGGWEKPEIYGEHLLVPRIEWMADLGLIEISKAGSRTVYKLTKIGSIFYNNLPKVGSSVIRDINENWLKSELIYASSLIVLDETKDNLIKYRDMDLSYIKVIIGEQISNAFNFMDKGNVFRISLYPTFLFTVINIMVEKKIIVEYNDILAFLKATYTYNFRKFGVKESGRITESYISIIF